MNKKIFTVLRNGEKIFYDVILTFKSKKTLKDYIVYTDNEYDNGSLKIYAAIYNPNTFEFISDDLSIDEWQEIDNLLKKYLKKQ